MHENTSLSVPFNQNLKLELSQIQKNALNYTCNLTNKVSWG